jgi:hypothetical protein
MMFILIFGKIVMMKRELKISMEILKTMGFKAVYE